MKSIEANNAITTYNRRATVHQFEKQSNQLLIKRLETTDKREVEITYSEQSKTTAAYILNISGKIPVKVETCLKN